MQWYPEEAFSLPIVETDGYRKSVQEINKRKYLPPVDFDTSPLKNRA